MEQGVKDSVSARKVQKADREKLRRDRLNEQFLELGNALDPVRPKNDKATILIDTIQMLKDFNSQVNRLKAEYASLSEESRELTQEKNELKEEKASLKSEIDNLNVQYQQRLRVLYPWSAVDPSIVMVPPAYPFPVPIAIPSGPVPIHPIQPYPFLPNPRSGTISNTCSAYFPYSSPCNPRFEQASIHQVVQHRHPNINRSYPSSQLDSRNRSSDCQTRERSNEYSDVATELELKTPGSAGPSNSRVSYDQDMSSEVRKGKQWPHQREINIPTMSSTSSRCSSSFSVSDCSSNTDDSFADN